MKKHIVKILASLLLVVVPAVSMSTTAFAACPSSSSAKGQVLQGVGVTGDNCSDSGINNTVSAAVEILSIIVGIAAVIMIINAGFKYITSGGDSNKVGNAKSTLVYALIGLVIAALAQFLVHYVLTATNNSVPGSCQYNSSLAANSSSCKP